MNFKPVLDKLLICKIASTHHENTEFDHRFISLLEWVTVVVSKWRPGRFLGRYAATSKSSIAWTNATRSMGARAVTILPPVIVGSSMKVVPAFSRSGLMLDHPVGRLPRVLQTSGRTDRPWHIAAT